MLVSTGGVLGIAALVLLLVAAPWLLPVILFIGGWCAVWFVIFMIAAR